VIVCLALGPALDVTYLVERLEVGEIHRPRTVIRQAGGKAVNVARAASVLGGDARVIAPLGGHTGALVGDLLVASGVPLDFVSTPGETRTCLTIAPDSGGLTEFYEPSPPLGVQAWRDVEAFVWAIPAEERIVLAGSVPPIDLDDLVTLLRGRRVVVDTHGAALAALVDGVRPEIVKVNRVEATALLSESADAALETLAEGIRARSGGVVVVTDGIAGSVALDNHGSYRMAPDPQRGRFAVGSGDCFLAGLLVGLERGQSLPDSLLLAAATASANARLPGAAVFDPAEVDAALGRIEVLAR
jgi:1-phosphofructokinase family hexose kinase